MPSVLWKGLAGRFVLKETGISPEWYGISLIGIGDFLFTGMMGFRLPVLIMRSGRL